MALRIGTSRFASGLAAAALGLLVWSNQASAVVITQTYDFTVTDFVAVGSSDPLSFTQITGSFSVNFDTAAGFIDNQPFTIENFSFITGPIGINYNRPGPGRLQIGAVAGGIGSTPQGTNDFFMAVTLSNPLDPQLDSFTFSQASSPLGVWFADRRQITVAAATPAPEPGTVALVALGLAGAGFARRRRAR